MPAGRVDSWIWAVRLMKTRSAGTTACKAGHVRVNGERAKPAQRIVPGDEVQVRTATFTRIVIVRDVLQKRVGASQAALAYDDRTPPPPASDERALTGTRELGAGRPTKRDRRAIDRLTGRR